MSYVALYRKWRPDNFDQVKGQDAVVRTLRNQILYDRIGHAYLFCGTRGTGKTSIAKLFAKAVNCQNPDNGNPCNECACCKAINSSSSFDVVEIDAASNNGVDNIRDIRDQVQYAPVDGKYKVFIIDEAHMLSAGAFNALLKTLEEPPSYVIFILATTEKHKIPITIMSRCQKYNFKRISVDTISKHLTDLMIKENIPAQSQALRYIARVADGSMRDALSLLDQCISFYLGEELTYANVLDTLGTVDNSIYQRLLNYLIQEDTSQVLQIIDDIINQGRELSSFLTDFLWYLRNLLLLQDHSMNESMDLSEEAIDALVEDASMTDSDTLLRYIRVLSDLSGQLRFSSQKRILLEIGFIKLCQPQMEYNPDSLLARIKSLEDKIAKGNFVQGNVAVPVAAAPTNPVSLPESKDPEQLMKERFQPAEIEELRKIAANWNKIIDACPYMMKRYVQSAKPVVSENSSIIQLIYRKGDMAKEYLESDHGQHLQELSEIISNQVEKEVTIECRVEEEIKKAQAEFIDLSKIHFSYNVE